MARICKLAAQTTVRLLLRPEAPPTNAMHSPAAYSDQRRRAFTPFSKGAADDTEQMAAQGVAKL